MHPGYSKVAESSSNWVLPKGKDLNKLKFAVTEKVHGANFCFRFTLRQKVRKLSFAKRKELLEPDEYFFGYKHMVAEATPYAHLVCDAVVKRAGKDVVVIRIYGELFGGGYPCDGISANTNVSLVQTGVYYSPGLHFYAFDISVAREIDAPEQFLDYEVSLQLFKQAGFLHAAPLTICSYKDAIAYNPKFITTIPKLLGLPPIDGNYAEGIVIRPLRELMVGTNKGMVRALLKIKTDEFSEKKYNQVQKPVTCSSSNSTTFDYAQYFIDNEVDSLLTNNRVESAMSKVGKLDQAKLLELVMEDLVYEFENNDMWKDLNIDQQNTVLTAARCSAETLVDKWICEQGNRGNGSSALTGH